MMFATGFIKREKIKIFFLGTLTWISVLIFKWTPYDTSINPVEKVHRIWITDIFLGGKDSLRILGQSSADSRFVLEVKNVSQLSDELQAKKYTKQKEYEKKFQMGHNSTLVSFSSLYKHIFKNSSRRNSTVYSSRHWTSLQNRHVQDVNCRLLFEGDTDEIQRVTRLYADISKRSISKRSFVNEARNCDNFIEERGYIMHHLSEEEKEFPIAFSIMVYKSPEQFELLLRSIYRPQNFYCVHVDKKTESSIFMEISRIVKCFPNVFLASRRVQVVWGGPGVLISEIICMMDLLKFRLWKYFINLTGQEFPLRTNHELVEILKIFNGANDISGSIKRADNLRWYMAGWPPHQIRLVKGPVHITARRAYVDYIINNPVATDFLEYTIRKTYIPDETFFPTLNFNPHLKVPGSYKGDPDEDRTIKPYLTRFKNWFYNYPCGGKYVGSICILAVSDLPLLARRPEFFANKFHDNFHPHALWCLDELHFNRTRDQFLHRLQFQKDYYQAIEFIKNVY